MTTISLIQQVTASDVFDFVCREFVRGSELHRAVDVGSEEFSDYFEESFFSMVAEKMSLVAVDQASGEITGCLLAGQFQPCEAPNLNTPKSIQAIKAILRQLEKQHLQKLSLPLEQLVLVDIAIVTPAASGRGIYTALRHSLHDRASELGFSGVIGELSSRASQVVCVQKLGHRLVGQVDYQSFQFDGGYPFSVIDNTYSIQLVEHLL